MKATKRKYKTKSQRSWPPIHTRKLKSGQTSFQLAVMLDGKRVRETFPTLAEAETRADQIRTMVKNEGNAAFTLPAYARVEAAQCIQKLTPFDATLTEATDYYVKHVLSYRSAPPVSEIVEKVLEDARANGRRPKTIEDVRYRLGRFSESFGKQRLSEISVEDLQGWANGLGLSPRSRRHFLTKISQLYRFAEKRGWCQKNLVEHLSRPDVEDGEPQFLTVEQCVRLLNCAGKHDLLPYVVLGLFCGIRVNEMKRLVWDKVKLSERVIIIDGTVAKTKSRRVVELNDTALAWLALCVQRFGPVIDPTNFRKRLDALVRGARFGRPGSETKKEKAAGIKLEPWPENALRHTCATYSYALTQDAVRVSAMLGNSPDVLHRHYRGLTTKSDAERFFALRPNEAKNVIPIAQAVNA